MKQIQMGLYLCLFTMQLYFVNILVQQWDKTMKKLQQIRILTIKIMYVFMLFLEFYRFENGKFIILLIFLALIFRYLYTRKVLQKIGGLIISLKNLQENKIQQIPENDEQYKKSSIVKQLKKVVKFLKNLFKRTHESQIDVSKKYSQFDMEESI